MPPPFFMMRPISCSSRAGKYVLHHLPRHFGRLTTRGLEADVGSVEPLDRVAFLALPAVDLAPDVERGRKDPALPPRSGADALAGRSRLACFFGTQPWRASATLQCVAAYGKSVQRCMLSFR